ncbi:hypothetical protein EX30DRAFT_365068 [Ascodesmis nigricans]|uniref:Uncharacterized protein n=1 Tax=Ascodesmis nigricans TaxID=341454 RepID=A0A4S2MTJ5_9PEZI|nr:hypothetical protein EX30DRAFT_365068 [Ascodesmis nigricans]
MGRDQLNWLEGFQRCGENASNFTSWTSCKDNGSPPGDYKTEMLTEVDNGAGRVSLFLLSAMENPKKRETVLDQIERAPELPCDEIDNHYFYFDDRGLGHETCHVAEQTALILLRWVTADVLSIGYLPTALRPMPNNPVTVGFAIENAVLCAIFTYSDYTLLFLFMIILISFVCKSHSETADLCLSHV